MLKSSARSKQPIRAGQSNVRCVWLVVSKKGGWLDRWSHPRPRKYQNIPEVCRPIWEEWMKSFLFINKDTITSESGQAAERKVGTWIWLTLLTINRKKNTSLRLWSVGERVLPYIGGQQEKEEEFWLMLLVSSKRNTVVARRGQCSLMWGKQKEESFLMLVVSRLKNSHLCWLSVGRKNSPFRMLFSRMRVFP